jgi:hypothetical protein
MSVKPRGGEENMRVGKTMGVVSGYGCVVTVVVVDVIVAVVELAGIIGAAVAGTVVVVVVVVAATTGLEAEVAAGVTAVL